MKMRSLFLWLGSTVLLVGACQGPSEANASFDNLQAPCTCGEPLGDLEGCSHELCMSGKNNPDNPDCICGPFAFANDMEDM